MSVLKDIEQINVSKITQAHIDIEDEPILGDILDECVLQDVPRGFLLESHRWFDTEVLVYEHPDGGYFGIRAVSSIKSEEMDTNDCYHTIQAFLMKRVEKPVFEIATP
jgi:hypothetical protein